MLQNLKKFVQGQYMLSLATYLMVGAVFIRTYLYYPHVLTPVFSLLFFLVALLFLEPIIARQKKAFWAVYIIVQIAIMVILFFLEPDGDTFSLLLLPATMFVMRYYQHVVAWMWVGIFSIAMSTMLFYGHQEFAPALIVIYLVAYILVASFSLTIRQYKEVQKKLVDANKQLRDYNEQVELLTAENERNHLARELHDSVTQTIFSMTLITSSTRTLQRRGSDQVEGKLEELQTLAQSALKEMRALVTQLRPLSISDDGLYPVLLKHISGLNKRYDMKITLEKAEAALWLNRNQQQEAFRIVQEALNNVIKHAETKRAEIKFEQSPAELVISISDDGKGFVQDTLPERLQNFGLESMQQRASELGGTLIIESHPKKGTTVTCHIQKKD